MRKAAILTGMVLIISACATSAPNDKYSEYHAYCRNQARLATFDGTPDEEAYYRICMNLKTYADAPELFVW